MLISNYRTDEIENIKVKGVNDIMEKKIVVEEVNNVSEIIIQKREAEKQNRQQVPDLVTKKNIHKQCGNGTTIL